MTRPAKPLHPRPLVPASLVWETDNPMVPLGTVCEAGRSRRLVCMTGSSSRGVPISPFHGGEIDGRSRRDERPDPERNLTGPQSLYRCAGARVRLTAPHRATPAPFPVADEMRAPPSSEGDKFPAQA